MEVFSPDQMEHWLSKPDHAAGPDSTIHQPDSSSSIHALPSETIGSGKGNHSSGTDVIQSRQMANSIVDSLATSSTVQAVMFWTLISVPAVTLGYLMSHSTWGMWFLAVSSALVIIFPGTRTWSLLFRDWILYKMLELIMPNLDGPTDDLKRLVVFVRLGPAGALVEVGTSVASRVMKIVGHMKSGPVQKLSKLIMVLVSSLFWLAPLLEWLRGGRLRAAVLYIRDIASLPGRQLASLQATTQSFFRTLSTLKDLWMGPVKTALLVFPLTMWELVMKHLFVIAMTVGSWTGKPKQNIRPTVIRSFSLGLTSSFRTVREAPSKLRRELSSIINMLRSVINFFRAVRRFKRP